MPPEVGTPPPPHLHTALHFQPCVLQVEAFMHYALCIGDFWDPLLPVKMGLKCPKAITGDGTQIESKYALAHGLLRYSTGPLCMLFLASVCVFHCVETPKVSYCYILCILSTSVQFWYHMNGTNTGRLDIVIVAAGVSTRLQSISGNQGGFWKSALVTVPKTITTDYQVGITCC